MTALRIAAALALAVGIGVWLVATQLLGDGKERPVRWRDLTAALGHVEFPRSSARIYHSRTALSGYLGRIMPGRAPEPPAIDFRRSEAMLVSVGPRSSTGYELLIVRVTENDDRVVVEARERSPSLGDRVSARLTYPYRLILLPASRKPVYLELEGRP